jgi:hypothetical protein
MTVTGARESDERYSKEETEQRREAALKRMLTTPHKPHDEMKIGKRNKPKRKLPKNTD